MLFHEAYGRYFAVVSEILTEAVAGTLTDAKLTALVREKAFAESSLTIPASLKNGTWPFLRPDNSTVLEHAPSMPLTTLERRWLKSLLSDPRIALFAPDTAELEDVEPLYPADAFVYYDRYNDGDPFEDPEYQQVFRTILTAIREKRRLRIRFKSGRGHRQSWLCIPIRLEYSSKDDKFRLISFSLRNPLTVNLGRIHTCQLLDPYTEEEFRPKAPRRKKLVLELTDERNALERVMLHFSHFEKSTEKLDDLHYRMTMTYEQEDETELLIRVLSFGPVLRVIEPESFIKLVRQRLDAQNKLRAQI
ncbi:MAG: WYL domain-containing protein [Ruminococcaceae bacterium]|nr:WYL domain-containing protein [Oscillospiraceae bacterium]